MAFRIRFAIPLLIIPILLWLGFSPLSGSEDEWPSPAVGFVSSDGATATAEFPDQARDEPQTTYETGDGIPSEPPEHQLVRLTNQERLNNGRPPLKAASELINSADYHSQWMAEHDCFDHDCPGEQTWVQRIENAGYLNWTALGENIAAGYTTTGGAINSWMNSTGHRDNMLNSESREAGGGYVYSGSARYHHYWTLDLGARNNVYPVIISNEAWSTNSLQVSLYVYGSGWASQMRFSNDGINWSGWESFSEHKSWTLSCSIDPLATVYAQIRKVSTTLESSDGIYVDVPLSLQPNPTMIFLFEQGSISTVPANHQMTITCCESWSASAEPGWIKLGDYSGSGSATTTVYLEGFPKDAGTHTGTVTVTTASHEQSTVQVTLIVTPALQRSYIPLAVKEH